jgi:hypothetical protein
LNKFYCPVEGCKKWTFKESRLNEHMLFIHGILKPTCKNYKTIENYELLFDRVTSRINYLTMYIQKRVNYWPIEDLRTYAAYYKFKNEIIELIELGKIAEIKKIKLQDLPFEVETILNYAIYTMKKYPKYDSELLKVIYND